MDSQESDMDRKANGREDEAHVTETHRGRCYKFPITVEPLVFAIFFSDALSDSVTANFILWRTCEDHFHYNKSVCNQLGNSTGNKSDVEAAIQPYSAALITGMNFLSVCLPAITSLFVGPWSDHNGRRMVLLIPAVGYILKYVILGSFSFFPSIGPEYALVAVVPVALCGGLVNVISAAYAYVSDITSEEKRFFRISMVEFVLGIGIYVALLLLSSTFKVTTAYEYATVYGTCAIMLAVVTFSTCLFLPESVQNVESGTGIFSVFELKHLKEMIEVCFKRRESNKRLVIFLLIACLTISLSVGSGTNNVLYLFTRLRYHWSIRQFSFWGSISLGSYFLGAFAGLLFGIMLLSKWLKIPEPILGLLSFTSQILLWFYMAYIPPNASYLMYYTGLISLFGGFQGPICRAILSKCVSKDDIGKVYALTSSCESFFPLIFGPLYTILYNATIYTQPNAFLLLSAGLAILCFIFFMIVYIFLKRPSEPDFDTIRSQSFSG